MGVLMPDAAEQTDPAMPRLVEPPSGWRAALTLDYMLDADTAEPRTIAHDRHFGPLRVLKRLYPEGPRICHHVMVHPPGGVVGGDLLSVRASVGPGAHAVLTTPGATRFYRSAGAGSSQQVDVRVESGGRLEWVPQESIAHSGCAARNELRFDLAAGGEMMGWEILVLGLPASGERFSAGSFEQRLEWPGVWLERARIDAHDERLLQGRLGLAGHPVLATLWHARGTEAGSAESAVLLESARTACASWPASGGVAGATAPDRRVTLVRALAHRVEPVLHLLAGIRDAWRTSAWGLTPARPRVWKT